MALMYLLELSVMFAVLSVAMWTVGRGFAHGLDLDLAPREIAFNTILGMAILGTLFVWLLIAGQFHTWTIFALLAGTTALGLLAVRKTARADQQSAQARHAQPSEPSERTALQSVVGAFILLTVAFLIFSALDPFRGFDLRAYQYPMAAGYAQSGGWLWFETLRFPTFPPLMNLWFATAILFGRDLAPVLSQLLALLPLLLVTALLSRWARELGASLPIVAGALFIGSPLVIWAGTYGFVDVAMAAFTTSAIYALHRFEVAAVSTNWQRDQLPLHWLAACGVLVGAAMNVKYLGAFYAVFCTLWLTFSFASARLKTSHPGSTDAATYPPRPEVGSWFLSQLAFLGPAVIVAAPWYIKTWIATGNPTFPFLQSVFGGDGQWSWRLRGLVAGSQNGFEDLTQFRLRWDSYNPWLLPIAAIALLLCLRAIWTTITTFTNPQHRNSRDRPLIEWAATSYFLTLFVIGTDRRYMLPAIALFCVLGAVYVTPALTWLTSVLRGSPRDTEAQNTSSRFRAALIALFLPLIVIGACSALGLGFLSHKVLERSSWPPAPSAYEDHLQEQVRGLKALRWIQTNHKTAVVYQFGLIDLAAFSQDLRILGDIMGPYSYWNLLSPLEDIREVPNALGRWDVDFVISDNCARRVSRMVAGSLGRGLTRSDDDDTLTYEERAEQGRSAKDLLKEVHRSDGVCVYRVDEGSP